MFKKKYFIIGLIVLLFFVVFFIYFLFFSKHIIFKNSSNLYDIVEVHSEYIPEGVFACYGNKFKCKRIDVSVVNNVDTSILGEYSVEYFASYGKHKKIVYRKVAVVDRQIPEITSESDSISVCPNVDEYNLNFSAFDNYDGDITSKVVRDVKDDYLILSVYDSSNNFNSKNISIVHEDKDNPIISLNGNSKMYVPLNSSFNDPGFFASDNCDGDITSNVVVEGSVNTSSVGDYTINYSVSDSSGNSTTISRIVSVYAPNGNGSKVIYLTFDDGPSAYTGELLDILARYNVKATFFVTGVNLNYVDYIGKAFSQGHSIALHTNSHNYSTVYSSVDAYFNDLASINEIVKQQTGSYSNLVRFPGGSSNTVSRNYSSGIMSTLSRMLDEKGYKYFDWNVSSGDASGTIMSSDFYANNVINGLGNGSYYIVLQHDTNINSIRAVGSIIEYGLSHGYSFKPLDIGSPTVHHRIAN